MSVGAFIDSIYQDNNGVLYNCRVQPETLTLDVGGSTNAAPAGPAGPGLPSAIMKSGRQIGVNARTIRFQVVNAGTGPFAVGVILTLPLLTAAIFNTAQRGVVITYQGATCRFVGKTAENIV